MNGSHRVPGLCPKAKGWSDGCLEEAAPGKRYPPVKNGKECLFPLFWDPAGTREAVGPDRRSQARSRLSHLSQGDSAKGAEVVHGDAAGVQLAEGT